MLVYLRKDSCFGSSGAGTNRGIFFHGLPRQGCQGTRKLGNLNVHFSRQGKDREFAKK